MPRVHVEPVARELLVRKFGRGKNGKRVPLKLRPDILVWMKENITSHWFMSLESHSVCLNFTCEYDATAWKLTWMT